jgi:hypothetical protein
MAFIDFKLEGLESLQTYFTTAPERLLVKVSKEVDRTLKNIEKDAKMNAPYDTGALRESIRSYRLNEIDALIVAGDPNRSNSKGHLVKYAGYQEFGVGAGGFGRGFGIPSFNFISGTEVADYASKFRKGSSNRKIRVPSTSFMFTAFDRHYGKMVENIKKIKI